MKEKHSWFEKEKKDGKASLQIPLVSKLMTWAK